VSYNPSKTGVRTICDKLRERYPDSDPSITQVASRNQRKEAKNEKYLRDRFWISLFLCIPIIISAWILPAATHGEYDKITVGGLPIKFLINWIFATPIQLYLCIPIYNSAWSAARYAHDANMDTLIALSTIIAYFYSTGIVIAILSLGGQSRNSILDETFFETSGLVIVLVLLGRYLEMLAKRQTSNSLSALLELKADTAILADDDKEIPSYLIQRDDLLKVLPGSKVPTDGIVVTGKTHIDESMLTGESLPVKKGPKSNVYGGTVNTEGMIIMRVTKVPGETELDTIAQQLEKTQMSKAPIERLTDLVSSKFVFFVIALAIIIFIIWIALAETGIVITSQHVF
jgi:Cu+-exporting ATPase